MAIAAGLRSLAAQLWLGDADVRGGVVLSVVLPILAVLFVAIEGERVVVSDVRGAFSST